MKSRLEEIFSSVPDPRVEGRCSHKLIDILTISLCTLIAGGEDFEDMVEFGLQKEGLLRSFLELPNGIPSHDTFNRTYQIIDSQALDKCLGAHGKELLDILTDKQICLDGKKLRGVTPTLRGNQGIYLLNAWVAENKICMGQLKVEDKSNEITAIPKLLEQIEIAGSIVSIDAIGCQKKIAECIRLKEADYLLAVKENQKDLFEEVSSAFNYHTPTQDKAQVERNHGRTEERQCSLLPALEVLSPNLLVQWRDVKTIIKIDARRTIKNVVEQETRYYISSDNSCKPLFFNSLVRSHWSIENQLHWHLDVTFNEDASRARKGNAPLNLSTMRKIALHLVGQMNDKISFQKRRYRAALNDDYLLKVLRF